MDRHLEAFFDELEKIGQGGLLGPKMLGALVKNVATNPVKYYAANQRMEKGLERHRQALEALENQTPAGWGPLGMRAV